VRMLFAACAVCNEPATGPDGLCTPCRVTPRPKRRTSPGRREQTQAKPARRR